MSRAAAEVLASLCVCAALLLNAAHDGRQDSEIRDLQATVQRQQHEMAFQLGQIQQLNRKVFDLPEITCTNCDVTP